MKTLNKFWKYFLNFIVLFLLVTGLTYLSTKLNSEDYKNIDYVLQEQSPAIEITEKSNKKITGTATNDMGALINEIYVKADFYDKDNNLLGTKYDEIRYFNVGEKAKFEISYNFKNVSKIEITATETK